MKNKGKFFGAILILLAILFGFDEDTIEKLKVSINQYTSDEVIVDKTFVPVENADLMVYFLDVGQADSILVKSNSEYMLIDAGNNEDGPKLVKYFESLGIEKFKYVIGTHAHEDHIGGMDDIINNFDVETFYMPDVITTTKTFEDVLDALDRKNMYFDVPVIGSNFNIGNSLVDVVYFDNNEEDLNTTSIILKLNYKNISVLFTGDTTSDVEKVIMNKDLESDVLKVAHHGSRYSSSSSFLRKVKPKYAVISVGVNNSYNHPHDEAINRLNKLGTEIYRTDELGSIVLVSDGNNINFKNINTDTDGN